MIISNLNFYEPNNYIPVVTQNDYTNGYISRFFVSRRNINEIKETNLRDYNLSNDRVYIKRDVKWKISGREYNEYNGKILELVGVVNYNNELIKELSIVFPNVTSVLNNPRQFWRGY